MPETQKDCNISEIIRRRRGDALLAAGYKSLLLRTVALVLGGWLLLAQVFLITQVKGNDMFPAVKDGDLVFAYRLQGDYRKNDVIVFETDGERRIGRVIGREGDVIMMDDTGNLILNGITQGGEILYPTYAKENDSYPYTVPEDHVFILGDYRTQTTDSRDFGAIREAEIDGKVITILRRRGI